MVLTAVLIALAIAAVLLIAAVFGRRVRGALAPLKGQGVQPAATRDVERSTNVIGVWVIVFALIGLCAIVAWTYGATNAEVNPTFWQLLGTDVMVGAAAAAVGALLGFVFGIPRTLDPASRAAVAAAASQGPAATSQAALAANTNLERVSDWLTTLIVGATLVQSDKVVGWIATLGTTLNKDALTNATLVPIVVVYFFALAFLGIYLITRLYLTFALQQTLAFLTGTTVIAAPQIVTTILPVGRVGASYGPVPLLCNGGSLPLRWSAANLPPGLTLDVATGQISGIPTAATAAGAACTLTVTDASPSPVSSSRDASLAIAP